MTLTGGKPVATLTPAIALAYLIMKEPLISKHRGNLFQVVLICISLIAIDGFASRSTRVQQWHYDSVRNSGKNETKAIIPSHFLRIPEDEPISYWGSLRLSRVRCQLSSSNCHAFPLSLAPCGELACSCVQVELLLKIPSNNMNSLEKSKVTTSYATALSGGPKRLLVTMR